MRGAVIALSVVALPWCAGAVAQTPKSGDSDWKACCENDRAGERGMCKLRMNGRTETGQRVPLQIVYYMDGEGPYILLGVRSDQLRKPIVRVDDNEPMRLTILTGYTTRETLKVLRRKSTRLVAQMRNGEIARFRVYERRSERLDFTVGLKDFGDAYERLQRDLKDSQ